MIPPTSPSTPSRITASRSSSLLVRNCSPAVSTDSRSDFTLICATASTVTATPCLVYRSCCGATSNDMSSSDRSLQICTMGRTSVPCPWTTRVPPKPYTMSASCGPALRYSLAIPLIRNRRTITPSPAKIQISTIRDISGITPPLTNADNNQRNDVLKGRGFEPRRKLAKRTAAFSRRFSPTASKSNPPSSPTPPATWFLQSPHTQPETPSSPLEISGSTLPVRRPRSACCQPVPKPFEWPANSVWTELAYPSRH